ncbi:MAG: redoxin domain-containing protein [Acidobacteriota bacterium]|nr:redoxin domain-containing protein [Acidobacteriota bacterium]
MSVTVGDQAPDFELASHRGGQVRLSDFQNKKHVVVAFHPLAFTPVCATQMRGYETDRLWFEAHKTHVLGISVDAVPAKIEWAKTLGGIGFDLLSDFHPHGGVADLYGVLRDGGISERAIFVVDKRGMVRFAKVYDIPALPDTKELRQVIDALG